MKHRDVDSLSAWEKFVEIRELFSRFGSGGALAEMAEGAFMFHR